MDIELINGKKLKLDDFLVGNNYLVNVVGETEYFYLVSDIDGIIVNFPKEIIKINEIPIKNNVIQLSDTLYNEYFKKERQRLQEEAEYKLKINFGKIYENRDLVFNKPEYFLIRVRQFTSGGAYIGGCDYCLGSLIESWDQSNSLILNEESEKSKVLMTSIQGSPLSGNNSWTGWSLENQKFVSGKVEDWRKYLVEFIELSKKYKIRLRSDFRQIDKSMEEIG